MTWRQRRHRQSRAAAAIIAAALLATFASAASGGAPLPRGGAAVSVASGAFRPSNESFRKLYGSPEWPFLVQVDVPVYRHLGVFGGVRWLTRNGVTIDEPSQATSEPFPLELSLTGFRLGGTAAVTVRHAEIVAGVGAEYLRGTERWPTTGLSYDVRAWGVVLQGCVRLPLWRHLSLLGLVEYASLPTDRNPDEGSGVNLGGVTFGGGASIRF